MKIVNVTVGDQIVQAVEVVDDRISETERRQESCRPRVRMCDCGGCGKPLLNETDLRQVRKMGEAVRQLFPSEAPAGRVKGSPRCRQCLRPKAHRPPPLVPAAAPIMKTAILAGPG